MKFISKFVSIGVIGFVWLDNSAAFVPCNKIHFPIQTNNAGLHVPFSKVPKQSRQWSSLQMVSYQDIVEKIPSRAVIDAVQSSPDGRVIASDLATTAGISLAQARKDLTALASLSRGNIAVDKDGELIYSFPKNLESILATNSLKYKVIQVFQKAWPLAFWLIRISFGVTLLVSLFAVFSTILFISSSSSNDDRRRDDRGMSFGGSYMWGPSPFDFFFYRPYGYYGINADSQRDPEEMGFFESVFSYIFGDGNPNNRLEEKRLSLAANMIRRNNGAVTAEQLAPFCDDAPMPQSQESRRFVDEQFVLPIVTALNGEPEVTDDGDIIYVFPDLQMTATTQISLPVPRKENTTLKRAGLSPNASSGDIKMLLSYNGIGTKGVVEREDLVRILEKHLPPLTSAEEAELLQSDPNVLVEQEWNFSLAPAINRFLAAGLGIVNLGGALYLGNLLGQYAFYGVQLPAYFGVVQSVYPLLLGYAVLFNAIPLLRSFWINTQNQAIAQRNKARLAWRASLEKALSNSSRLGKKLAAARRKGTQIRQLGKSDDIVFDTNWSGKETKELKEKRDLQDFDKLLNDQENTN